MFHKNVWRILIIFAIILWAILIANPVEAKVVFTHGPNFNVSFNPGSAQVGQDVNIHIKVDSNNPGATKINPDCGGVSKGETSEVEFDSIWRTVNCSGGNRNITICTKASDDPQWQDPNCQGFSYNLSQNNPQPTNAPSPSCSVDNFDVWPQSANVGDDINITGKGSCNVGIRAIKVKVDGNDLYEIGSTSLSTVWHTGGVSAGNHKIKILVAGQGDNDWNYPASQSVVIQLNNPNQPPPPPSSPFHNSDVINISGDIYIITVSNGQVERHHVPNPDTLDALGITRNMIDNKGWSDSELKGIHKGSDVPDVNRDYQGFINFKNKYFPNTIPINTPIPQTNPTPGGRKTKVPQGSDGKCPSLPARLKPGDIAVVVRTDLNLRSSPDAETGDNILRVIPEGTRVTIIAGPVCNQGARWYEIGFSGHDGWVAEANSGGYHLRPNKVSAQPTKTDVPSQDQPDPPTDPCAHSGTQNGDWSLVNFKTSHSQNAPNCAQYVFNKISNRLEQCLGKNYRSFKSGGQWDNWISDEIGKNGNPCGITIRDLTTNDKTVQSGDVIVWDGYYEHGFSCTGVEDHDDDVGHVAFFLEWNPPNNTTFKMDGENWSGDPNKTKVNQNCMHVIHIPGSGYKQDREPQTQPTPQPPTDKCSQYAWWDPRSWWCRFVAES